MPDSEFDEAMNEVVDYEVSDEQIEKRVNEMMKRLDAGENLHDILYGKDRSSFNSSGC